MMSDIVFARSTYSSVFYSLFSILTLLPALLYVDDIGNSQA